MAKIKILMDVLKMVRHIFRGRTNLINVIPTYLGFSGIEAFALFSVHSDFQPLFFNKKNHYYLRDTFKAIPPLRYFLP